MKYMHEKYDKIDLDKMSLDELSKSIFMKNGVLRMIMKHSVPAFAKCELLDISKCFFSNNPSFDPEDVNSIVNSLGCEDSKGKTRMDYFTAMSYPKNSERKIDVYVNLEAQGYDESERERIFRKNVYSSRLVLNQIDVIRKVDYRKFADTVSIWIYIGTQSKESGNIIISMKTDYEYVHGELVYIVDSQNYSMIEVSIYLGESDNEMIDMLNRIYKKENIEENIKRLESKYGLKLEKEMNAMCSLDEYVKNQGIKEGKQEGIIFSLKNLMKSMNMSLEEAMQALGLDPKEQKKYIKLMM